MSEAVAVAVAPIPAEVVAAFVVAQVRRQRGRLWDEGRRREPLGPAAGGALELLATRRVRGVSLAVARGLLAWAHDQRPADLLVRIPSAAEVLGQQARGRRFVSLVEDHAALGHGDPRHPDGLSFVLHDLEHLEKFVAPEHHRGQVGFFRAVARAFADPAFAALQAGWDAQWRADRDYVISDMNGSAIFLFSVLKMKVNMAVRRHLHADGRAPYAGALSPAERAAVLPALETLVDAMALPATVRAAALTVSARRDDPVAARALLRAFESLG